jgi:hypothetical protein
MIKFFSYKRFVALCAVLLLGACVHRPAQMDYTAFRNSKPRSILVLPPINQTSEVGATYGMLSQMTMPLAEAGYYVVPVAEMDETFKHNGLTTPADIQNVAPEKLRQIFGVDAALYTTITAYGTKFKVIDSQTIVTANAKLVDLRSGTELWHGTASANGKETGTNFSVGGLTGMIATAIVTQVANTAGDKSYDVAGLASQRLLSTGGANALLYGPHSPKYGTD